MTEYKFAQASWRIIKEFVGIYGVKIEYNIISKLPPGDIEDAFRFSNITAPLFMQSTRLYYNYYRNPTAWKMLLLKKVAMGYKNLQFYQELEAKIVNHKIMGFKLMSHS